MSIKAYTGELTKEYLEKYLTYDPQNGEVRCKESGKSLSHIYPNKDGVVKHVIKLYHIGLGWQAANSLAWTMITGENPGKNGYRVEFIDGDIANLKSENLRQVPRKVRGKNYGQEKFMQDFPDYDFWSILDYNPDTGKLTWKHRECNNRFNACFGGKEAGNISRGHGYRDVRFEENYRMLAHRVIYTMMTGKWLKDGEQVDHINHDRQDNRWCNLRVVNQRLNGQNQKLCKNNTSGFNGVRKREFKYGERWEARIYTDGKEHYLGRYHTYDEAIAARKAANITYGFHVQHGT